MADFAGRWIGRIEGTNSGNFLLDIEQRDGKLSGRARLNDAAHGVSAFDAAGETTGGQLVLDLAPKEVMPGIAIAPAKVQGVLQNDGSIRGDWQTELGTAGTFVAVREQQIQQGLNSFDPQAAAATAILYERSLLSGT